MDSYEELKEKFEEAKLKKNEFLRQLRSKGNTPNQQSELNKLYNTYVQITKSLQDQLKYYGETENSHLTRHVSNPDFNRLSNQVDESLHFKVINNDNEELQQVELLKDRSYQLLKLAGKTLSQSQKDYFRAYYNEGKSCEEIGNIFGVDKTTVSRTINRAKNKMKKYIVKRNFIDSCYDEKGLFDWDKFLKSSDITNILTDSQRRIVFLYYSHPKIYHPAKKRYSILINIAKKLYLEKSTVSRVLKRGNIRLIQLGMDKEFQQSNIMVPLEVWKSWDLQKVNEILNIKGN